MKMRNYIWMLFLLVATSAFAQEVSFTARVSKNTLGANEKLRIEFSFNENGDHFQPPSFENFQVVMGPSSSSSYSWVNGKSSFSKTFTYILAPTQKGTFTIGSASITFKGQTYQTKPIKIEVTQAVSQPSIDKTPQNIANDEIFGVAEVSNANPYVNEPVSVIYRVYIGSGVGVSDLRPTESPKYQDFWSQDIPMDRYEIEECTYQGKPYRCVVVKRVVLYPQKSGKLSIEPMNVRLITQVPTGRRDFFGRQEITEVEKNVLVGKRSISVQALPEQGKPANFSGAVGEFDMEVSLSKNQLKANESLQALVKISGKGNFKLFDLPKMIFPSSLEVYEPEMKEDVQTFLSGMKGSKQESYTIVPQYKGQFPINPVSFSYFNPKTKKYETITSEKLTLEVTEGPSMLTNNAPQSADANTPNTQQAQFRFLKLNPDFSISEKSLFFGSKWFYALILIPILLIPIIILIWSIRQRRANDVVGSKIRSANRLARKYLSEARKQLGQKDSFYESLERSLHNYLKAKLHIETSEMSKDTISDLLRQKSVEETTITDFISLLKNCEMARYGRQTPADMKVDYDKASQIISQLDRRL